MNKMKDAITGLRMFLGVVDDFSGEAEVFGPLQFS